MRNYIQFHAQVFSYFERHVLLFYVSVPIVFSHFEKHLAFTLSMSIDQFMIKARIYNNTIKVTG